MNDTATDRPSTPDHVRTGRPLDGAGDPVAGPALELDPSGRAAELFQASPHPLVSDPVSNTWAALLETPDGGEHERPVLLQWLAPDAAVPPGHVHPRTETFETVDGEVTVVVEGDPVHLAPGESVTVQPGAEHTFRNDTDDTVVFRAELPGMRTIRGLYTIWGITHERARMEEGEQSQRFEDPGPLRALLVSEDLYPETEMTVAPTFLQRVLWGTVGQVARSLGHRGIDERFLDDGFWQSHVEQPRLGDQS